MSLKDRLRPLAVAGRRVRDNPATLRELAFAAPRSMSQFGEDRWLLDHFGDRRDGFFVDVGAFHPHHLSNTHLLSRRGWHGINLEPNPAAFAEFERHRRRDTNLPYAISTTRGPVAFAAAGSFAGIDDDTHLWSGIPGERLTVEARPLSDVLDEHLPKGRTIDVLDVDCEGHDLQALQSNDWQRYRPRVVLAEHHDGAGDSPQSFLESNGYRLATRLHLTLAFVDAQAAG